MRLPVRLKKFLLEYFNGSFLSTNLLAISIYVLNKTLAAIQSFERSIGTVTPNICLCIYIYISVAALQDFRIHIKI